MSSTILQTEDLTKHYGTLTAVKNLSLQVFEGQVYEGDVITLDNFTRECYIPATGR